METRVIDERFVLKECPFCGGKPAVRRTMYDDKAYWWIQCKTCGSETRSKRQTADAIALWNRRHDQTLDELKDKHVCANCKWRSDEFTSVCVNDASEHLADFVKADDECEWWEGK